MSEPNGCSVLLRRGHFCMKEEREWRNCEESRVKKKLFLEATCALHEAKFVLRIFRLKFFSSHDCCWCCCCSINIPATTTPTKTPEKSRVAEQSQNVSVRAMPQSTGDLSTTTMHESFRQSKWCNFYECFLALRHCCCSCSSLALFSLSCTI